MLDSFAMSRVIQRHPVVAGVAAAAAVVGTVVAIRRWRDAAATAAAVAEAEGPVSASGDPAAAAELLRKVAALKADATHFFGQRRYDATLQRYQQALDLLARFSPLPRGSEAEAQQHVLLANVALVLNRVGNHDGAAAAASTLLAAPGVAPALRAKAHFRRAAAHEALGRRRPQLADLEAALALTAAGDAAARAEVEAALARARATATATAA